MWGARWVEAHRILMRSDPVSLVSVVTERRMRVGLPLPILVVTNPEPELPLYLSTTVPHACAVMRRWLLLKV